MSFSLSLGLRISGLPDRNLLVNGSVNSVVAPWEGTGSTSLSIVNNEMQVTAPSSSARVYQTLASGLIANKSYNWGISVTTSGRSFPVFVMVNSSNSTSGAETLVEVPADTAKAFYSGSFVARSGDNTFFLSGNFDSGNEYFFDNASLR